MAAEGRARVVTVRAFAKINVGLRVLGRRPDGFHELQTTFQSVALHDTLTLTSRPGPLEIECDVPGCPSDRRNLVWQAAEGLWRASGRNGAPRGVHVMIRKRIPLAAGLGGGSGDAAAALRAFRFLWRPRIDARSWERVAAALGADVPFMLQGGTALGVERGDRLFQLVDARPNWVVIVVPEFGVSTKDAYAWWDEARPRAGGPLSSSPGDRDNDLQDAVVAHHPEIGRLIRRLRREGALHAAMSGSGSAVFGLFQARDRAERVAAGRWRFSRAVLTRTLNLARFRALASPRALPHLRRIV